MDSDKSKSTPTNILTTVLNVVQLSAYMSAKLCVVMGSDAPAVGETRK